ENFFSRFEILGIYASLNGHIFILGKEGLTIYDGQNFTSIGKEQGIAEPGFYGISLHAPSNQFWFSSGKKIQFYRTEELPYFTPQELDYPKGKLFLDSKGNLWWNNLQEQLWFKLQEGNLHQLKVSPYTGFPDFEDKAGGIWSTHGNWGGVIEAKGTIRYTNDSIAFLPLENAVKNIFEDEEQQIWITTHGSKVHRINERGLTTLPCYADFTVGEAGVVCMSADKKGRMWITGSITNYLLRVDEHELSYFNFPVEAQEIIPYSTKDNNNIITDKEGNIWLLSGKRTLIKYDGSTFWKYDFRDYLDFSLVDFAKDEKDRLWLATSGDGLLQFDGQFLRFFRTTDGLLSDRMTAITCDFENRIWVTSNDGICALQEVESDNYYIHTFNQNKSKKSVFDKEFSFSEEKQLGFIGGTMFNLNAITTQKSIPQNFGLAQLDINQQFVDYQRLRDSSYLATLAFGKEIQASFSSVPKFLNYPLDLTLPHYLNHLTFYFTATDWEAPHKIRYSFKMDGIDGDWSPPQAEPVVDYRNLPHGQHTLLAKVKNESNLWSEPFRYQFTIRPPWWQTIWAYLAYGVMAIVGVLAYIRWRTKSLLKRQEALENTVTERTAEVVAEKERSEELLLNILPAEVAEELKQNGTSPARNFDEVTILFTDFKQFTALSEQMAPQALVAELNVCFKAFDEITTKYKIEKIKTIGDAYMAAGGLHLPRRSEPQEVVLAALEMQTFMLKRQKEQETIGKPFFEMRCGIHTGPVVAGIVGVKKFQYDIWGDTVNTAARMESNCEVGRVNMSQTTYELLKENKQFDFTPRGKVEAKGKGKVEMYFVDSTR
ncbi:MAG: adenylate/guanylate cyclase domain-containing protein, partial [Bacteroidota bacterium]